MTNKNTPAPRRFLQCEITLESVREHAPASREEDIVADITVNLSFNVRHNIGRIDLSMGMLDPMTVGAMVDELIGEAASSRRSD